jgi:hypothetical protein
MALKVRPIDPATERALMLEVLERNLTEIPHARRFDWFYGGNPAGRSFSFVIAEESSWKPVGIASLVSRAIWVNGEVKICGQVGDFGIDKAYRSLGPAVQLQRATFEPVDRGEFAFCYDCPPHEAGMSTFRRLGMRANCRMRRYVQILKTDARIEKHLGRGLHSTVAAKIANAALRVKSASSSQVPGTQMEPWRERFGDEFTKLDQRGTPAATIRSRRTAADLNWLYRDNPLQAYDAMVARRDGELIAYAIYFSRGDEAHIAEVGGEPDAAILEALLGAVSRGVRDSYPAAESITALLADEHPIAEGFRRAGFLAREEAERVVAYAAPGSQLRATLEANPRWLFQFADVTA